MMVLDAATAKRSIGTRQGYDPTAFPCRAGSYRYRILPVYLPREGTAEDDRCAILHPFASDP